MQFDTWFLSSSLSYLVLSEVCGVDGYLSSFLIVFLSTDYMSCSYRNFLYSVLLIGLEFGCLDRLPTGRTKSSDWETHAKLCTPVSASVLRQRNTPVPHTVGHCSSRLSFLKSLSADVPEYQRDIKASRSVGCSLIWSETLYSVCCRSIKHKHFYDI